MNVELTDYGKQVLFEFRRDWLSVICTRGHLQVTPVEGPDKLCAIVSYGERCNRLLKLYQPVDFPDV